MIGRLFASGEFFHPRSKLGVKGVPLTARGSDYGGASVSQLIKLGHGINLDSSAKELSRLINDYLAKNALVLVRRSDFLDPTLQAAAISAQEGILLTGYAPTTEYFAALVDSLRKHADRNPFRAYRDQYMAIAITELAQVEEEDVWMVEHLLKTVDHADIHMRELALSALGNSRLYSKKIIWKFIEKLGDPKSYIRILACYALKQRESFLDRELSSVIAGRLFSESDPDVVDAMVGIFSPDGFDMHKISLDPELQIVIASKFPSIVAINLFKRVERINHEILIKLLGILGTSESESAIDIILNTLGSLSADSLEQVAKEAPTLKELLNRFASEGDGRFSRTIQVTAFEIFRRI